MKCLFLTTCIFLAPVAAAAQSNPPSPAGGWTFGLVPTTGQWAQAWQGKMDYTGSPACTLLGCTLQGKINLLTSTTNGAGLNCGQGATPTTPVNGDVWCTTGGVFARINGSTVTLGGSSGTLSVPGGGTGQVSFTANRPLIGNGTGALAQGTVTTTNGSTLFATAAGTPGNGNCAAWNNGNVIDAGVGACGGTGGAGTVTASPQNQIAYYSSAGTVATVSGLTTCNSGYIATSAGGVPSCQTALAAALQGGITTVGTIGTGIWQGTVVSPAFGGTGANNTTKTITLNGANLALGGGADLTLTTIGTTNVTLPTGGNIPNSNGTSGGIPYYNTATTLTSSGVLGANLPLFGGGAGAAPIAGTRSGNTTQVMTATSGFTTPPTDRCASFDAVGNIKDSGQPCGTSNAAPVLLATMNVSVPQGSISDVGNCATVSPDGCLGSTYTSYTIFFSGLLPSSFSGGNVFCQIQVALAGAAYQTSGYLAGIHTTAQTLDIPCSTPGAMPSGSTTGVNGYVTFFPHVGGVSMWNGVSGWLGTGVGADVETFGGAWNSTGTITGFRIFFNGAASIGAINITGVVKVYGNP